MKRWTVDHSKFLSKGQVAILVDFVSLRPERTTIMGLLYTGTRAEEAVQLNVGDYNDGKLVVKRGKGNVSRTILLSDDGDSFFSELTKGREASEPLYVSRFGRRFSKRGLQRQVERVFQLLNLPFSTHSLRHTYCTMLINAGEPISTVKSQMGHSNIAITDVYSHACGTLKTKKLL